ncbi:MAG: aspartate aminotransferase family protein [Melioribacteraceae bacterium]|nr:aspartate aminotransferase family protein [Melioribacteraceae bacterium]
MAKKELQFNDYSRFLVNTYKRHSVNFISGNGIYLHDDQGRKYLDFLSGIAVTGFGHNHPKLVTAAVNQIMNLWHVSNLFESASQSELAAKLAEASGLSGVFFCNSGTEANEAAIKFARKYGKGRSTIITTLGSFHGRTMGSLSASAQFKLWDGFHPLTPGFKYVPYNDIEAVISSIEKDTVGIMVEPIQGESGIIIPDDDYLQHLSKICSENDILLILDEVQTGIGRTGKHFSYQWYDVQPDIVTSAKGIANGLPLGAVICSEKVADIIQPGMHGSTFGGNPVAVSAANMVMNLLDDEVLENIKLKGAILMRKISELNCDSVKEIRGKGLMIGVEFHKEVNAKEFSSKLLRNGVITTTAGENVLRLLPPYIITEENIDNFINVFAESLNDYIRINNQKLHS